jgi:nitrate reductase delta subunit
MLEYPATSLERSADELSSILVSACAGVGEAVAGFCKYMQQVPLEQLQEIYTSTFDLQGTCHLYIGQYIFGENYKRSWFMAKLNEGYRERGFSSGNELPDHAAVVLRFLAQGNEDEYTQDLLDQGLKPALEMMLQAFNENDPNPYRWVILALSQVLQEPHLISAMHLVGSQKEA